MDWSDLAQTIFMSVYTFVMVMVSIYGLHRYGLVFLYYRYRRKVLTPPGRFEELPLVTVQDLILRIYRYRLDLPELDKRIAQPLSLCLVDLAGVTLPRDQVSQFALFIAPLDHTPSSGRGELARDPPRP